MPKTTPLLLAFALLAACEGPPYPDTLAETGLFAAGSTSTVGPGVRAYAPRFELWSDGATKRRWLFLPRGTTIDTSAAAGWTFPVGTKAWKEFTRDGKRVETRLLWKTSAGSDGWVRIAYVWNAAGTEARAAADGTANAHGTDHDVPGEKQCGSCHANLADGLAGVSALQLDHAKAGMTLASLTAAALLTPAPKTKAIVPGDTNAQAALGYLHTNCAGCHNRRTVDPNEGPQLDLELPAAGSSTVAQTPAYATTVGKRTNLEEQPSGLAAKDIIAPGQPERSLLLLRMKRRGDKSGQMPPIASERVDNVGAAALSEWIRALK